MSCTIDEALLEWKKGNPLIVIDHEDRENEGDLIIPAQKVTPEMVNFFISEARGLLCAPVSPEIAERCGFTPMIPYADKNTCNFAISVDAREGTSTGISATERANTILKIADFSSGPRDFIRPGHMFPLLAKKAGTLFRAGHTEATIDLCRLGGYIEVGMICEIINADGTMARTPDLENFAKKHTLKIFAIDTLIAHRRKTESVLEIIEEKNITTEFGDFDMKIFREIGGKNEHISLTKGDLSKNPLIRVHSENMVSDIFLHQSEVSRALEKISKDENGGLIYIRHQEVDRTEDISPQRMSYGLGAQILENLGVRDMRLLTVSGKKSNTPKKIPDISSFGLQVTEFISF